MLIERDALDVEKPDHRPGVPHGWHIHNLTIGGQRELETLFPGFVDSALRLGAMRIDHAAAIAVFTKYGWKARVESELVPMSATRILFEYAQRERFLALVENARLLCSTRVTDLLLESTGAQPRVVGVATNHPIERNLRADLVVDCSGRASGWKTWLASALPTPLFAQALERADPLHPCSRPALASDRPTANSTAAASVTYAHR